MKKCTVAKPGKVGETSSKYGYPGGGEAFVRDCQRRAEDVALDTPERKIVKLGETTTDTGWLTQREERRKARIEHENRNK